jgi:hypothetical protein
MYAWQFARIIGIARAKGHAEFAPIIGASKPHHLADAVAATEFKLDARTIGRLEEHAKPVAGHT